MKRSGPPERKTPMKRTGGPKRSAMQRPVAALKRVAVNPVSAKQKQKNRERAAVIAGMRLSIRTCQANPLLGAALRRQTTDAGRRPYLLGLQACRLYGPLVGHEPQKRSRRGSIVDPANILLVCDQCNAWCEIWVDAATAAGLLVPSSFERDGRA